MVQIQKNNFINCFKIILKTYCLSTSLHGHKYLVQSKRPKIEKYIWLIMQTTTIIIMSYIFYLLLYDYKNKIIITTLKDPKYSVNNVPFPAVAICDVNRISKKQVLKLSYELHEKTNVSVEDLFYLFQNFGELYNFEMKSILEIRKLHYIIEKYDSDVYISHDILKILKYLAPSCSDTLRKCKWMGKDIECRDIFTVSRTREGFCCTFNYKKFLYYTNLSFPKVPFNFIGAGYESGLTVLIYSNASDYYYPLANTEGFSVNIFNPYDYPDTASGALNENFVPLKHEIFMQVTPSTIKANQELRSTSIIKRGCVFNHEGETVFDNIFYSYSDCLVDCKLKSILGLCECVPFFLPVLTSYLFSRQICTLLDTFCLNKYNEKWRNIYPFFYSEELTAEIESSLYCPQCFPSCSSTSYIVDTNSVPLTKILDVDVHIDKKNLGYYSLLHVYTDNKDSLLFESDIYYYWFDVISNFGGTCSLFLGFSVISIIEFIYFITIKYYQLLQKENKKTKVVNAVCYK